MAKYKKSKFSRPIQIILILVILVFVNMLSGKMFFRLDLTSEKRYSISEETKEILRNLEDIVLVRVYLDGELNIPFNNFKKSIIELLDEFKVYGKNNIQYEFVDPFSGLSDAEIENVILDLNAKGLRPTSIRQKGKGESSSKLAVPGAMVVYNGVEYAVNLLVNLQGQAGQHNLNASTETLEYNFIQTIKNITAKQVEKIAFLEGHGEWHDIFLEDIMKDLSKSFQIDRGQINGQPGIMDSYKAVIIAGPTKEFPEADKYVLDQYLMQGGKVLWLLNGASVNRDSLALGNTIAFPNPLNLDDLFFKYGVRINNNIVQDMQSGFVQLNTALANEKPRFERMQWPYSILASPPQNNSITKNLNKVQLQYASSLDTVGARSKIKKTPLLLSSGSSNLLETPRVITLSEASQVISKKKFAAPSQMLGVLLEGEFESVFKNRMIDQYFKFPPAKRLDNSTETKMAIISDGNIIKNEIYQTKEGYASLPLGYDRNVNYTYANKKFILNLINYLTGNANLMNLRSREFKLRLLNQSKIEGETKFLGFISMKSGLAWQLYNIFIPILVVILFAVLLGIIRKKRFASN